jgi:periplasmic protein TonB
MRLLPFKKWKISNTEGIEEIIFKGKNKEYGAYYIRKIYYRTLFISLVGVVVFAGILTLIPIIQDFLESRNQKVIIVRNVTADLSTLKQEEMPLQIAPPPIPDVLEQKVRFKPPKVIEAPAPKIDSLLMKDDDQTAETSRTHLSFDSKDDAGDGTTELNGQVNWASFGGGSIEEFRQWVEKNFKFPDNRALAGIQGRVIVQFRVNKEGMIEKVKIIMGLHPLIDEEAKRVVSSSPKWKPCIFNGHAVDQEFTLPVFIVGKRA